MWSILAGAVTVALIWLAGWQVVPAASESDSKMVRWALPKETNVASVQGFWQHVLQPALATSPYSADRKVYLLDRLAVVTGWSWTRRYLDLENHTLINQDAKPELLRPFDLGDDGRSPPYWVRLNGRLTIENEQLRKDIELEIEKMKRILPGLRNKGMHNQAENRPDPVVSRKKPSHESNVDDTNISDHKVMALNAAQIRMISIAASDRSLRFAKFDGSSLFSANLNNVDARKATFREARMQGIQMSGAHLEETVMDKAKLHGANLLGAHLDGAHLTESTLHGANIKEAHLSGADLRGSRLIGATMDAATFYGADLSYVDASGASLSGADLSGAFLSYANLDGTHLNGVNIGGATLDRVSLNLTSGTIYGCESAIGKLSGLLSADIAEKSLKDSLDVAGILNSSGKDIVKRTKSEKGAMCKGSETAFANKASSTTPEAFAKGLRDAACSNKFAAYTIVERLLKGSAILEKNYFIASANEIAAANDVNCPSLVDIDGDLVSVLFLEVERALLN